MPSGPFVRYNFRAAPKTDYKSSSLCESKQLEGIQQRAATSKEVWQSSLFLENTQNLKQLSKKPWMPLCQCMWYSLQGYCVSVILSFLCSWMCVNPDSGWKTPSSSKAVIVNILLFTHKALNCVVLSIWDVFLLFKPTATQWQHIRGMQFSHRLLKSSNPRGIVEELKCAPRLFYTYAKRLENLLQMFRFQVAQHYLGSSLLPAQQSSYSPHCKRPLSRTHALLLLSLHTFAII